IITTYSIMSIRKPNQQLHLFKVSQPKLTINHLRTPTPPNFKHKQEILWDRTTIITTEKCIT
ncbi:MAG: hypothetical protein ACPLVJ_01815, partial [Candidatus Bathyarchaeales archaeon]